MTYKIKSALYLASLVLTLFTNYYINQTNDMQARELANNIETVSNSEALK